MAVTPVALRASTFVETIGVNVHLSWKDTVYGNISAVASAISTLGIKHLRDGAPLPGFTLPDFQRLATAGAKFTCLTDVAAFEAKGNYSTDIANMSALNSFKPGALAGIEGFNEINLWAVHYNGSDTQSNLALGNTLQQMLYQQVKSSALSNIPVLCLTVGGISNQQASVIGDLTNYSDYGAWHVYFGNGDQPRANIQMGIDGARNLNRSDPIQITETGYYTAVNDMSWGGGGVSEPVQAKLILNIIFVCASLGIARHHIYELVNDGTGPDTTIEGSFGLFHNNWTPKPAATAIGNLTRILADSSTSFTPGSLDFSVSGLPSSGRTFLMQKSNGAYDLAIWAEPKVWDQPSKTAVNVGTTQVTVTLAANASSIKVYDPLVGTSPISSAANTNKVTVGISDHPIIVEIGGTGTTQPPPPPPPTATESPDGTTATKVTDPAIVNSIGEKWTLVDSGTAAGLRVAVNGVADTTTSAVVQLAYYNHVLWQKNSGGLWWGKGKASDAWTPTNGTSTAPGPVTPPPPTFTESPDGTTATAVTSPAIVNSVGEKWTLVNSGTTAGLRVAVNGVADTTTSNVVQLSYYSHVLWYKNSSGLWRGKGKASDAWTPTAGTTTAPGPVTPPPTTGESPSGTTVTKTTDPAIVNSVGEKWTLVDGGTTVGLQVAVNGVVDRSTQKVVQLKYVNHVLWQQNIDSLWWGKGKASDAWTPTNGTATAP
jgi:hypothetical protein